MKKIALVFALCLACGFVSAQNIAPRKKVQIVLLGSPHLTPSTTDVTKNDGIDLKSPQRQREIEEVVNKIVAFKPDQICVEFPFEGQKNMDSLFAAYKAGKYALQVDEIDLFAMQAAKKLGLPTLTCANYSEARFDFEAVMASVEKNKQQNTFAALQQEVDASVKKTNYNLANLSLRKMLLQENKRETLEAGHSVYTRVAAIGKGKDYAGANLLADWYNTNIHIYTHILRRLTPTDQRIFVLFGQGHIPILRQLFQNNPDFEVVEVGKIF